MTARGTTRLTLSALLGVLTLLAAFAGCDINPVPEPPSSAPVDPPDTEQVTLEPDFMMGSDDVDVRGGPGAASPGHQVWAVNLDGTAPPTVTDVNDDGSFAMTLSGFAGDELRLQVRLQERRSDPVDVIVPATGGPAIIAERPLAGCLLLDPPLELLLPKPEGTEPPAAVLVIENRCDADVVLGDQRLRVASPVFAIEAADAVIAPGGFGQVVVRAYGEPGTEEVLLLHVDAPEAERRPVTLVSQGGATGVTPECAAVGGTCMSDPMDITFPADCEELGRLTLQASCEAFNHACCSAVQ